MLTVKLDLEAGKFAKITSTQTRKRASERAMKTKSETEKKGNVLEAVTHSKKFNYLRPQYMKRVLE